MSERRVPGSRSEPAQAASWSGEHARESLPRLAFSLRWLPHGLSGGVLVKVSASSRASRARISTSPAVSPWERSWGPRRAGLGPHPPREHEPPRAPSLDRGRGVSDGPVDRRHCDIRMAVPAGLLSREPGGMTFGRCSFSSLGSTQRVRHSHRPHDDPRGRSVSNHILPLRQYWHREVKQLARGRAAGRWQSPG